MSSKPIVPVFSGESQNEAEVFGNCYEMAKSGNILIYATDSHIAERCKPETLRISLDNGVTFRSVNYIKKAIETQEAMDKMSGGFSV